MKKLIAIMTAVLILTGCAVPASYPPSAKPERPAVESVSLGDGVARFVDVEAGVVCWTLLSGYGTAISISCMPAYETTLEAK